MKPGILVKHRLSEGGMIGFILKLNDKGVPVIHWDDGRTSCCLSKFLEAISD